MLGGGSPFGCTTVENITDKQRYSKEITIDDVARALEADGQRPKKWGAWLMFRCPNGAAHKNRDRKPSAGARISAQGNLVTSCMTCHQNELVRDYINGLLGIGNYTHFRSSTFTNPDDRNRDDVDDQTKIRLAQRDFDLAYPIPDRQDSPPRLWLAEKCGFYGRVPDAIKWEPDVKNDMIGSIIAMLAPLRAWTDAYPDVPDLTAVHRVGINAEGRKAFGFYLEGEWQDKKSRGVMVGSMVFIGDATSRSIVRVTEGVADALAVYGRWRQPTVALCGTAGLMNGKIARDLAGYDEVIIHADGDSPGKTPALKLRDKIREFGGTAYAFAPARGKDPADALGEIGEPLHGDDPDDAFWKSAQSPTPAASAEPTPREWGGWKRVSSCNGTVWRGRMSSTRCSCPDAILEVVRLDPQVLKRTTSRMPTLNHQPGRMTCGAKNRTGNGRISHRGRSTGIHLTAGNVHLAGHGGGPCRLSVSSEWERGKPSWRSNAQI